jgi:enamine deaminase RidA (YjgF/YER057c/UK114 family)
MNEPNVQPYGRRLFLGATALGLASGAAAGLPPGELRAAEESAVKLQALAPAGAPAAAKGYSPGILASGNRVVFVSGQGPADLTADMETQIRQTFDRIGLILQAGGASFRQVAIIRAYFVHLARDLPAYRKVRLDYLTEPFPASTAVGVPELAIAGLDVEIEAIAIV